MYPAFEMLTRTCELAVKTCIYLGLEVDRNPLSPRQIAKAIECSPSYLAKTTSMLVKAGLLRSLRGTNGGVMLARAPEDITLLEIIEACQGLIVGSYCRDMSRPGEVCSFHRAMQELHEATIKTLSGWTLAQLMESPARCPGEAPTDCKMFFEGCDKYSGSRPARAAS
jgi:Rrf2 family protein